MPFSELWPKREPGPGEGILHEAKGSETEPVQSEELISASTVELTQVCDADRRERAGRWCADPRQIVVGHERSLTTPSRRADASPSARRSTEMRLPRFVISPDEAGKSSPVVILLLVPLVPVAGLLFLLGAERLERGHQDSGISTYARSRSALGDTVDRAREVS